MRGSGQRVAIRELGETPEAALATARLEPQPCPDPAWLGGTDVLVAVRSAGVGWVDLMMACGQYQHVPRLPYCPGLEYAGEVVWVGSDVRRHRVGDRVLSDGMSTGPRSGGAHEQWGGFASYAVAPEAALRPIPDGFDFDQAACFLGSYETAYHCLIARGRLGPDDTVLIHGASGATGLAAVHIARQVGARIIATGRSPEKLEVVRQQGADHVLTVAGDGLRRLRDEVRELTGGRGADIVYDGVGGPISLETLRALRFGARYLIVGWAATPFAGRRGGGTAANVLPTNLILMKGLDVLGCPTVIATQRDPTLRHERLARLEAWAASGALRPHVSHRYSIGDFKAALMARWRGEVVGGCVLHP